MNQAIYVGLAMLAYGVLLVITGKIGTIFGSYSKEEYPSHYKGLLIIVFSAAILGIVTGLLFPEAYNR